MQLSIFWKIMKKLPTFLIMLALSVLISGCNLPLRQSTAAEIDLDAIATNVQLTIQALNTPTSMPITKTPVAVTNGATATKTSAPLNVATITPTYSAPMLGFDNNVNCRQVPGTNFRILILIKEGQKVDIVGVQGDYWIVKVPNSSEPCWLPAEFATPEGSVWTVPTVGAPDIPTETPPFNPVWKKWNYYCTFSANGTSLTMEMEWSDKNTNEDGFRILRDGESIAELGQNFSSFTDTVALENGQSYDYSIEVYRGSTKATSSVVNASCQ
jgi:hypothetical protein